MNLQTLLPILGELLVKSALVFTAALLINAGWHRASSAQRHLVWCLAFAAVLLLPATRLVEPRWPVPLVTVRAELPAPPLPAIQTADQIGTAQAPAGARRAMEFPGWRALLVATWIGGAAFLLSVRAIGSFRLRRIAARCSPVSDPRVRPLTAQIAGELGIGRSIALLISPAGCVPLTWGTFLPTLLLPASAATWSDAHLEAALRHEAGHIARRDHLTRLLAQLACALYWPNPLAWVATRAFCIEQEQATDDLVLRSGTLPEEYAAQLFDIARTLAGREGGRFAIAMASPSTLERRLRAVVDDERSRQPVTRRALVAGAAILALALSLTTAAQLRAEEKKTADAPARGPQIMIEAKFVEIGESAKLQPSSALGSILRDQPAPNGVGGSFAVSGIITPPQFTAAMQEMNGPQGVDVLSTPRVTTLSGQRATIEIARQITYPTDYEKDGAAWKPKAFATRNVGVNFALLATAKPDGTLDLELTPSVVELLGFIDQDDGKKYPANAEPGVATKDLDTNAGAPAGRRAQPVFSERKITTSVSIFPGQTVVLGTLAESSESKDFPRKSPARRLAVFVTADLVKEPTASPPSAK